MDYHYAPGYGVIANYLISVKGQKPNDVDWDFFTHQEHSYAHYVKLCEEHQLTSLIERAKLAVATDLIKAGYIEKDKMHGDYYNHLDYFTELSNLSWGAFDNLLLRDDAKYQTVIDFHASLKKDDPAVGHLAGKPFTSLTESDVLELFLFLNPFFYILTDYIADWTEEPYGKLEFIDDNFYSMLMTYANGKSTVTVFNDMVADEHPELMIGEEEEKDTYIEEFKELMEAKGFYPDITSEKAKEMGLLYDVENDEVIIKKCANRNLNLIIPKTIDGVPVKQIKTAIQRSPLSIITSAVVFADLDYICDYAFSAFPDLLSISLLGNVKKVGANFADKTQVDTTEKDGVIYVKVNTNPYYMAVGFNESLADNIHLDKTTKFISSFAFIKSPLKSIIMDGVVSIGNLAFSGCKKLDYITFSKNLKYIGERAFAMCPGICDIEIDVEEIPDSAFYSCDCLQNFKLGPRVKKIGLEAFGNTDLFEFTIPESVESFNSGMFGFDSRITDVIIPGNRKWKNETTGKIYEAVELSNSKTAAHIILNSDDAVFTMIGHSDEEFKNPVETIDNPKESVESADEDEESLDELIEDFKSLLFIKIPTFDEIKANITANKKPMSGKFDEEVSDDMLHISEKQAKELWIDFWDSPYTNDFSICNSNLTCSTFHVPISIGGQTVGSIGDNTLKNNPDLKHVIIHGHLSYLGHHFLQNCTNVESVTIKNGIDEIGYGFLEGNANLLTEKDGVIYANVNGNPYYVAVESDKNADVLFIEKDCEVIGNSAFEDCNVQKVTIPNAKIIGSKAFFNCKNLSKVVLNEDAVILDECFGGCDNVSIVRF